MGSHVEYGDHDFTGRCGVTHELNPPKDLSKGKNGQHYSGGITRWGQHTVCTKCNAYEHNAHWIRCFGHTDKSEEEANAYLTPCAAHWRSRKVMKCKFPKVLDDAYFEAHPDIDTPELF